MIKLPAAWLALISAVAVATAAAIGATDLSPRQILAQEPTPTPSGSGSVVTTIDPVEAPGPCVLLSTETINYGTVPFSSSTTPRFATGEVTVTNCSVEPEHILAAGADATGSSATWTLVNPPASGNTCEGADGGINRYAHTLHDGVAVSELALTNLNQTYQTDTAGGAAVVTATSFRMPCSGSNGAGELMSTSITFTAVSATP